MRTALKPLVRAVVILVAGLAVLGLSRSREQLPAPPPPGPGAKATPSQLVGLSIHMTTDDYGVHLVKAFRQTLDAAGVHSLVTDAQADAHRQKEDLQRHIAKRVDALVIVPFDDRLLTQETQQAKKAGIPVVAITTMPGSPVTTTILGREHDNGYDAGRFMVERLGGKGKVMMIDVPTHLTRIQLRLEGFREALRDSRVELVSVKKAVSKDGCMAAVEQVLREHPDLQGIFAPYGTALIGAASAIRVRGRPDIVLTGIDADHEVLGLIDEGWVAATLAQYPSEHGRLAAESVLRILRGEPPANAVQAPFRLVTRDNAAAMSRELWGRELH